MNGFYLRTSFYLEIEAGIFPVGRLGSSDYSYYISIVLTMIGIFILFSGMYFQSGQLMEDGGYILFRLNRNHPFRFCISVRLIQYDIPNHIVTIGSESLNP